MIHLVLKNDIDKAKLDALLFFLKSWNIEVDLQIAPPVEIKKEQAFSLSVGLWKDYAIDADQLRKQVWNRKR